MNDEQRAARRSAALERLYETKRRIQANSTAATGLQSNPNSTWSGGSTATKRRAPDSIGERLDPLPNQSPRPPLQESNQGNDQSQGPNLGEGIGNGSSVTNRPPTASQGNESGQGQQSRGPIASRHRDATQKSGLLSRPYVEYDMSTIKDSKGGFMDEEQEDTQRWLDRLPQQTPLYPFDDPRAPTCFECGTKELDFRLYNIFGTRICGQCRRANPEKYSLLTKTECKADYLLTEPELKDKELLAHMERPNPYKNTYSNMMLFMRYQVEEFAFKKWDGPEGLDAEWERREKNKATRKRAKFESKLRELRNKTRAQTITGTGRERHKHTWGEPVVQSDGMSRRECECGMSIEELSI